MVTVVSGVPIGSLCTGYMLIIQCCYTGGYRCIRHKPMDLYKPVVFSVTVLCCKINSVTGALVLV